MKAGFEIVEKICPRCGNNKSYKKFMDSAGEYGECTVCGGLTYHNVVNSIPAQQKVRCPYCNSTSTKKISTMSKVGSIALWGIFAVGKTSKQWHCNNCKSDF